MQNACLGRSDDKDVAIYGIDIHIAVAGREAKHGERYIVQNGACGCIDFLQAVFAPIEENERAGVLVVRHTDAVARANAGCKAGNDASVSGVKREDTYNAVGTVRVQQASCRYIGAVQIKGNFSKVHVAPRRRIGSGDCALKHARFVVDMNVEAILFVDEDFIIGFVMCNPDETSSQVRGIKARDHGCRCRRHIVVQNCALLGHDRGTNRHKCANRIQQRNVEYLVRFERCVALNFDDDGLGCLACCEVHGSSREDAPDKVIRFGGAQISDRAHLEINRRRARCIASPRNREVEVGCTRVTFVQRTLLTRERQEGLTASRAELEDIARCFHDPDFVCVGICDTAQRIYTGGQINAVQQIAA